MYFQGLTKQKLERQNRGANGSCQHVGSTDNMLAEHRTFVDEISSTTRGRAAPELHADCCLANRQVTEGQKGAKPGYSGRGKTTHLGGFLLILTDS